MKYCVMMMMMVMFGMNLCLCRINVACLPGAQSGCVWSLNLRRPGMTRDLKKMRKTNQVRPFWMSRSGIPIFLKRSLRKAPRNTQYPTTQDASWLAY